MAELSYNKEIGNHIPLDFVSGFKSTKWWELPKRENDTIYHWADSIRDAGHWM